MSPSVLLMHRKGDRRGPRRPPALSGNPRCRRSRRGDRGRRRPGRALRRPSGCRGRTAGPAVADAPSAPKPGAVVRPTRRRVPGTGGFPDRLEASSAAAALRAATRARRAGGPRRVARTQRRPRVARTAARSAAPKSRPRVSIAGRRGPRGHDACAARRAAMADAPSAPARATSRPRRRSTERPAVEPNQGGPPVAGS